MNGELAAKYSMTCVRIWDVIEPGASPIPTINLASLIMYHVNYLKSKVKARRPLRVNVRLEVKRGTTFDLLIDMVFVLPFLNAGSDVTQAKTPLRLRSQ